MFVVLGAVSAWFLAVPAVLTASSFFTFAALLAGCIWVTTLTYINGRPAASLAQSLHDADVADAAGRDRQRR